MSLDLNALGWPEAEAGQALVELCRALGWAGDAERAGIRMPTGLDAPGRERWLRLAAARTGADLQATDCAHGDMRELMPRAAPALACVMLGSERRYLALLSSGRSRSCLLTPSLERRSVRTRDWVRELSASSAGGLRRVIESWLSLLGLRARDGTASALARLLLAERRADGLFLLRLGPGSPFLARLRQQRVPRLTAALASLAVLHLLFVMIGWAILGRSAALAELQPGWLAAWVLAQATAAAVQVGVTALGGSITRELALLLKQRLFGGALELGADQIRQRGSGRLLSWISESAAIETAGLGSALALALSTVELCGAALVLSLGAGGLIEPALLLLWCGLLALLTRRYLVHRRAWSEGRFTLAQSFVENVIGYRTRCIQQRPARWHELEEPILDHYLASSMGMDQAQHRLAALPARGWLMLGLLGLVPVLLTASHTDVEIAIALGGILQAYGALGRLSAEVVPLCGALVAWSRVSELFHAGRERPDAPPLALPPPRPNDASRTRAADVVLDVRRVRFGHDPRQEPILRDCSLRLMAGDRVVLEGSSGSGKSTLAALIAGLREPRSGCILTRGLDRASLGPDGWRSRIAAAPQFNDNYLFSAPLAFNLLMSRAWPPAPADLEEAAAVCRELGLGPLIGRMPSGLDQVIGETGWQLSHGERSRVFLARALLQHAELVVLDESFAALDPVTLRQCVAAVLARTPTVLVIAHP